MPRLSAHLDGSAMSRLREIQRLPRGTTSTEVETRLLQLADVVNAFEGDIRSIVAMSAIAFDGRCKAMALFYNETRVVAMGHEDAAVRGWLPRRRLSSLRERATIMTELARDLRSERVRSEAEIAQRLSRALLPARRLRSTQDGPISDQYYIEPIDSK